MSAQLIEFLLSGVTGTDGTPLAAGKVYHYTTGTTTLKDLYSDQGATTPVAQPLVLDSRGSAAVFGDGIYKFVICDSAGAIIQTIDGVDVGRSSTTGFLKADGTVQSTGDQTFSNTKGIYGKNAAGTSRHMASVDSAADTVLLGNTSSGMRLRSISDPVISKGGADLTVWHSGNSFAASDTSSLDNGAGPLDIAITNGTFGVLHVWTYQNGIGQSYWQQPFIKRSGTLTLGTPVKTILTADPLTSITVVSNEARLTLAAANSYVRAASLSFWTQ